MADLTEQQKLEIHNKIYQAGKGMIPVQELTYAASRLCEDYSEENQVEVLRDLKQFSMPGVGTTNVTETIAAEAVRDSCDRNQNIQTIMTDMNVPGSIYKVYRFLEGEIKPGSIVKFGRYIQTQEDADNSEGSPLEWIVLKVEEKRALLLSLKCIDKAAVITPISKVNEFVPYTETLLGNKMNQYYNDLFNDNEREFVLYTKNLSYVWTGSQYTFNAYLFALSINDITSQIIPSRYVLAAMTPYVQATGSLVGTNGSNVMWWLRNGAGFPMVYTVRSDTYSSVYQPLTSNCQNQYGYRPAFWLKLYD